MPSSRSKRKLTNPIGPLALLATRKLKEREREREREREKGEERPLVCACKQTR